MVYNEYFNEKKYLLKEKINALLNLNFYEDKYYNKVIAILNNNTQLNGQLDNIDIEHVNEIIENLMKNKNYNINKKYRLLDTLREIIKDKKIKSKKRIFRETKLNFQAPKLTKNKNIDGLKVAVISFNTEAIKLYNTRLEQGKGDKTQVFTGNDYKVKSKGWRIGVPFFKGGERIAPEEKKLGLKYIRELIEEICNNKEFPNKKFPNKELPNKELPNKEFPDLIFFGMQESKMTFGKSDKSLQSMLYELNAKVKNDNNENKKFYSLYRSGAARIGKEGYRGNRLGIFVRQTVELKELNKSNTPNINFAIGKTELPKFNKTSCGKESAIVFDRLEGNNNIEYTHHSGSSEKSPKFYCDPYPVLEMWRYLFGDKFEKQSKLTKSNNYGYLKVTKKGKEYSFSVMNLHLPFIRSNIEGHFGAKQRDELLNKIYENMYVPDSTLILMGDLNYRFVSDKNYRFVRDKNNLANESRFGKNDPRKNKKIITCPLKKGKPEEDKTEKDKTEKDKPEFEYNNSKNQNELKVPKYGICDRVIYKEGEDKEVYLQKRGETHKKEVAGSDHALVYSVFKIE